MRALVTVIVMMVGSDLSVAACDLPADTQQTIDIVACGARVESPDNKDAIDAALNAASNRFPGIFVPPGTFVTSGGHIPPAHVGVYGAGVLKLAATSTRPIINTAHAGNQISGLSFDLSAGSAASRVAVDIDGGSTGTVVSNVTINFGRIIAYVTNGGSPPADIDIRNNVINSALTGGTSGGAIDINSGTSHFSVVGNRINGDWNGQLPVQKPGDGAGIDVASGASYGQISLNDSHSNAGSGIYLLSGQYISVSDNNCSGNRQSGIGVNSNVNPRPGRLTISGNICSQNLFDGIDVNEAGPLKQIYLTIVGNYLASNGPPPGGGGTGINLDYAANVAISSNTIYDNAAAGIWINECRGIAVTGNVISGNSRSSRGSYPAILLLHSSHNSVSANISPSSEVAPSQSFGIEERDDASDYNLYSGNHWEGNVSRGILVHGIHDAQSGNL
jgi:parallel beta-helix repeat protein